MWQAAHAAVGERVAKPTDRGRGVRGPWHAHAASAERAVKASWGQVGVVLIIVCALAIGLVLLLSALGLSPDIAKVIGAALASAFMYSFVARGRSA